MNTAAYVIIAAIVATGLYFCVRRLVGSFSKFGGSRPVTCPENGKRNIVEVDAIHATMTSAFGHPDIRLQNCSRWPLNQDCGQECLVNLDVAPDDCLVSGVLMRWYEGKICVYCRKKFEAVHWIDHRPALRTPEGTLIEWGEVTIEDIPTVLETHFPVCWDCYIAQTFKRDHPDLVVYRPWQNGSHGGADSSSVSHRL
jgi:hypothetical protein